MIEASAERWQKWRRPANGVSDAVRRRRLVNEARLKGVPLTKKDLLAAGLRPLRYDKSDVWAALTPYAQKRILAASKAHMEAQLAIGIDLKLIYGPWTVLNHEARWEDKLSKSTLD